MPICAGFHTAGLKTVLEEMSVSKLWMHLPWSAGHTNNISEMFKDGRITDNSVREYLRKSLENALELEQIAANNGIDIIEPFVGRRLDFDYGMIEVAGPTENYYESLLPEFSGTPQQKTESYGILARGATELATKVLESWSIETLDDSGETSAENNSSTILLLTVDNKRLLFTADAGIPALTQAVDLLEASNIT